MEDLQTITRDKVQKPKLYKVILINDDYTTMEFVIEILVDVFKKSFNEAYDLTMETHNKGRAIAGIFSRDIAETMARSCEKKAKANGFPFRMGVEPE